jgi:hypothetical protein
VREQDRHRIHLRPGRPIDRLKCTPNGKTGCIGFLLPALNGGRFSDRGLIPSLTHPFLCRMIQSDTFGYYISGGPAWAGYPCKILRQPLEVNYYKNQAYPFPLPGG